MPFEWYCERQHNLGFQEDDIQDYSMAELPRAMFDWNRSRHKCLRK